MIGNTSLSENTSGGPRIISRSFLGIGKLIGSCKSNDIVNGQIVGSGPALVNPKVVIEFF